MITSSISLPSGAFTPKRLKPGNIGNWSGHLPFARDLVAALRPSVFVELGTHYGESYFGLCQAIAENQVDCKAYAIDTWRGEHQSGYYDESIYEEVAAYNEANYADFSYLVRGLFDDALSQFDDESIDLLHIDGLHTFDAVSHDFYSWLPKVKPGGIVLFHDVAIRHDDFGVWKLWETLAHQGLTFEFQHASGLGVFEKPGSRVTRSEFLDTLFTADPLLQGHLRRYYALSAAELEWKYDLATRLLKPKDDEYLLQVFRPTAQGHTEEQSRTVKLTVGDWQRQTIELLSGFSQGSLRIDIANRPCVIDLRGITIRSSVDHRVLWTAGPGLPEVAAGGTLIRLVHEEDNGAVRFLSYGFDPQLYLPEPATNRFDQPLELEIWLRLHNSFEQLAPIIEAAMTPATPQPVEQPDPEASSAELERRSQLQITQSEFAAARAELEAAYQQLSATRQQLETREEERELLLSEINAKQTNVYLLSDSHAAMKDGQKEFAQLEQTHEALQEDYEKLEASFRQLMEEHQSLETAFHGVLSSHSWKITSPMRTAIRLLARSRR